MKTIPLTHDGQPDPLMTVDDLIHTLKLGRSEVYRLLATGELPSLRIGRLYRVTRSQLDAFIASRTEGAA